MIFFSPYSIECMYCRDGLRHSLTSHSTFSEVLCEQTSQDVT